MVWGGECDGGWTRRFPREQKKNGTMDLGDRVGGWQPDLPDHRDYTLAHDVVRKLLRGLKPDADQSVVPSRVDWRGYCTLVEDQGKLPTSGGHACVALVQYFERRAKGR